MQSAASQATSNNLQLCYQKYLYVGMLPAPNSLETRKQNYIIIFTSLSGSSQSINFVIPKFFQK